MDPMDSNGPQRLPIALFGALWEPRAPSRSLELYVTPKGSKWPLWFPMTPYGSRWIQMTQNGSL